MQRKMGVPPNRLKRLRKEHDYGISQQQLAELCGVTQKSYSRWENWQGANAVPVPSTCAIKLCQYFGCSLDYLYGLTDDPTPPPNLNTPAIETEPP
ncbi:MAG: helix-turn-helix transcriptional regulator [Ruminococcaceae bacterium]|nr:helix-turn-helix transcriptional regulator [Oscillospiraceae bacterium]